MWTVFNMKFFLGRSHTFWIVHPKTGTVRKIPLTNMGLGALFLIGVSFATFMGALTIDKYTGGLVNVADELKHRWALKEKENLLKKQRVLEATVVALQRQNEETKRINARVENKLYDLQGLLGDVAGKVEGKSLKAAAKGLFKRASHTFSGHAQVGAKAVGIVQQRRNLQKLDHIVRQLKGLPLSSPVPGGVVTSRFGYRQSPFGGAQARFHHGIDISLHHSPTVRSAGAGVVRSVERNSGYGLVLDIQHSRNVVTRYAHLASTNVNIGQRVKAGEVIAAGGSSGRSTGRHLHYEVRIRGRTQNPETFMNLSKEIQMVLKSEMIRRG